MTKSCPNFTKFCTGYSRPFPKLIPKDQLKMIKGFAGISDLVNRANIWARTPKLKIHLLVANLKVWDVLRHNLHVIARAKQQEERGFDLSKDKTPKGQRLKPKTKERRKNKALKACCRNHFD